jgi:hypothetical protein
VVPFLVALWGQILRGSYRAKIERRKQAKIEKETCKNREKKQAKIERRNKQK